MTRSINLAKYTSVRIGQTQDIRIIDNISPLLPNEIIIGGGCNILVSKNPPPLAILSDKFSYISMHKNSIEIGAAMKSAKIYHFAKKNNIAGFEILQNIPGSLGGLIKMNAGLCGLSISDNLSEVLTPKGWIKAKEFEFGYRKSSINEPIFAAKFNILNQDFNLELAKNLADKRSNQPKGASFGSCFKNPQNGFAGELIQKVGLKGYSIGGAKFSQIHANFLINFNNATFKDAISLIELAQKKVKEEYNIELQTEVVIL